MPVNLWWYVACYCPTHLQCAQHYERHIWEPTCSCKHWFLQTSPVFIHWFCLNNMHYIIPLKISQVTNLFSFYGPMVIFNPHLTFVPTKTCKVWNCISQLRQLWSCNVLPYKLGLSGWALVGGGGPFGSRKKPWPSRVLWHSRPP